MSFHFRKLRLKDWLVYGGEITLEFPDFQTGKNLVVINGQNGFGKTSLLRSLDFVFHGRLHRDDLLAAWHEPAKQSRHGSLEVDLEFTHGNKNCRIIRGADFKPWGDGLGVSPWVKLIIDGEEETAQIDDKIEQLLPKDCLEFVFFDGAEISRYAQKNQDSGVLDAIEKVLGIPAVRNLREDLQILTKILQEEQEALLASEVDAKKLLNELEDLNNEEESYSSRKTNLTERRSSLERTQRELERKLKASKSLSGKEKSWRKSSIDEQTCKSDEANSTNKSATQ